MVEDISYIEDKIEKEIAPLDETELNQLINKYLDNKKEKSN